MKGATVAGERDALPGNAEDWSAFVKYPRGVGVVKDMLRSLAHIPYSAFPPKALGILGDILLTKRKLHAWMILKGYELPPFLCDLLPPTDSEHLKRADESPAKPSRARPRKSGWRRLEQLVRERHAANPAMPLGTLAFDACKRAATEFRRQDLPSWETVLRHMKAILAEPAERSLR